MDERDWLILTTLFRLKNITKTANTLYLSQPALTARIKHIEEYFGAKLLYRSNKGVSFTPQGEFAAEFAKKLLQEITAFKEKLQNIGDEIVGVLKIGSPSIIGRYYVPALLEGFQALYPKVKFEVVIQPSSEIFKLINSRTIDFAFTKYPAGFSKEESLKLLSYRVMAVYKEPFTLQDLPNLPQVSYPYEEYYHRLLHEWWTDNFRQPPKIGSHVSNLDLCKEMVFNGLGYGLLPEILVREGPKSLYTEVLRYKNGQELQRDTWLLFKKESLSYHLCRLFYEYVKKSEFSSFLRARNK